MRIENCASRIVSPQSTNIRMSNRSQPFLPFFLLISSYSRSLSSHCLISLQVPKPPTISRDITQVLLYLQLNSAYSLGYNFAVGIPDCHTSLSERGELGGDVKSRYIDYKRQGRN